MDSTKQAEAVLNFLAGGAPGAGDLAAIRAMMVELHRQAEATEAALVDARAEGEAAGRAAERAAVVWRLRHGRWIERCVYARGESTTPIPAAIHAEADLIERGEHIVALDLKIDRYDAPGLGAVVRRALGGAA